MTNSSVCEFKLLVSYHQILVYDASMDNPFNDWRREHLGQGFAWPGNSDHERMSPALRGQLWRSQQATYHIDGFLWREQPSRPSRVLHGQVGADPAFAKEAADVAARGHSQVDTAHLFVCLLVKTGVLAHQRRR